MRLGRAQCQAHCVLAGQAPFLIPSLTGCSSLSWVCLPGCPLCALLPCCHFLYPMLCAESRFSHPQVLSLLLAPGRVPLIHLTQGDPEWSPEELAIGPGHSQQKMTHQEQEALRQQGRHEGVPPGHRQPLSGPAWCQAGLSSRWHSWRRCWVLDISGVRGCGTSLYSRMWNKGH